MPQRKPVEARGSQGKEGVARKSTRVIPESGRNPNRNRERRGERRASLLQVFRQ